MHKRIAQFALAALASLAMLVPGGCTTSVPIVKYPVFYTPQLTSIAVAEFANASLHPRAGSYVAERVVAALRANGTYKVVLGPEDLRRAVADANQPMPPATDHKALAAAAARAGAQAVLVGTVDTFAAERAVVVVDDGYYGPYGRRYYRGYGYRAYSYETTMRAVAAAEVALLEPNGAVVYAPRAPLAGVVTLGGAVLGEQALAAATDALAAAVLDQFAIVDTRVPVSKREVLRTAAVEAGGLRFTEDYRETDKDVVAVVNLPPEAARNDFRLAVFRRGEDRPLAELPFTWRREDRDRRFEIAVASLGAGEFDLRLYRGNRKIEDRTFRIGK